MRVLISVSEKRGVQVLAKALLAVGAEIISTGGTAEYLKKHKIPVTEVSAHTGFPEIMNGRVKTLHPKIFGGILARRDKDQKKLKANKIEPIDWVIVNLYPFEKTVEADGVTEAEAVEQIDIGGPSLIRAAAKNFAWVTVVTDSADYATLARELKKHGEISSETRKNLARKAFELTAEYDRAISGWFRSFCWLRSACSRSRCPAWCSTAAIRLPSGWRTVARRR